MSLSTNTTYRVLVEKLGDSDPNQFVGNEGEVFYDPSVPALKLSDGSTTGGLTIGGGGGGGGGESYWVSTTAGIHTTSNVGIGTTNPQTKLEINGILGFGTFDNSGTRTNIRIGDNTTGANLTSGFNNIFMGIGAGNSTTTGSNNTFFGPSAGRSNTTGCNNNFFGNFAGAYSSGSNNNFFGQEAGTYTTGGNNNFFSYYAGYYNTTGCNNNFLGAYAGRNNTTGCYNNFFGNYAGCNNTTGCYNNFFGLQAGQGRRGRITTISITSSTTLVGEANNSYSDVSGTAGDGSNATFFVQRDGNGDVTTVNITTEGYDYNVGNTLAIDGGDVGGSSGTDDITITVDTVVGSTGSNNNFFGLEAGCSNTTGEYNNFFGNQAGRYNTTGTNNNFFGNCAGYYNTTGFANNFLGVSAGRCNTTGCYNNFFGYDAGRSNITGGFNNFLGPGAGYCNTTGCYNNFFGKCAGYNNTEGSYNTFFGYSAGYYNTTGVFNNFFGCNAGFANTTGSQNNFLGRNAGRCNTTGNHNTFLGAFSGISTSASRKVILGSGGAYNQLFDSPDTTKDIQFAVGVRTDANPAEYWLVGDENFNVGIGTTNPTSKLTVQGGDVKVGVNTSHGVILTSPNGTQYRLIVDNSGVLSTTPA